MNSQDITRAIIGSTIDRGFLEMAEDPKRSIRKLTDLGRRFSKSRFQTWLFSLFQELLRNDDSSYYQVLSNLLKNTRWDILKTFGINVGYNGWTYGAKLIREQAVKTGHHIPWAFILHFQPGRPGGITLDQISSCLTQGKELGIHCCFLWQEGSLDHSDELLGLIENHPNYAFIWQIPDLLLDRESLSRINDCKNLMLSLPYEGSNTQENAVYLHKIKALFMFYLSYENDDFIRHLPELSEQLENYNCSLLLLIAKDNCSREVQEQIGKYVYNFRLEQNYPFIPMDLYEDFSTINNIISDIPWVFEILSDGLVKASEPTEINMKDYPSLKKLFSETMPSLHSPKTAP